MQKYTKIKSITTGGACCWAFKEYDDGLCECVRVFGIKMTNWWLFGESTRLTKEWSSPSWMKKLSLICLTIPPNFPSQTFQLSKHDFLRPVPNLPHYTNSNPSHWDAPNLSNTWLKVTSKKVSLMLLKGIVSSNGWFILRWEANSWT